MRSALHLIHHDGSELYVQHGELKLGGIVELSIRIPTSLKLEKVSIRTVKDGEPVFIPANKNDSNAGFDWYVAKLEIHNPRTSYRWLISGGDVAYGWLNQEGWQSHDVNDGADFIVTPFQDIAPWSRHAVFYQIFPDRFASSGRKYSLPHWVVPRRWDQLPEGASPNTGREYFGGDFWGVAERLDYLQELGIDVLYFTPFFPAGSTHRYDAATFDEVDPLLGGNEALIHLVELAHARGMKVLGDITLNHSGNTHEWFKAAQENNPMYREFYIFNEKFECGYESWLGHSSLPKFNYRSEALQEKLITGEQSVIKKWLRPPFNLDGWRVDVANMSGRLGELDMTHEVARMTREAVHSVSPEKILIAEHNHDAGPDLNGDGWQGNMNYTAFRNPVWNWLVDEAFEKPGRHGFFPKASGPEMVAIIRSFASRQPWNTYSASWNLLGSHDSARVRTMVESHEKHRAASLLLFTLPGSPMIFAGDEIGVPGKWGEDARTTHPWDGHLEWDKEILAFYKELIALRKSSSALTRGGLRFLEIQNDYLIYLRESKQEKLLICVARASCENVSVDLKSAGIASLEKILGFRSQVQGDSLMIEISQAGGAIWRAS